MALYTTRIRQVLPTLETSTQGWGIPGVTFLGTTSTGSPGWDFRMFEVIRPITVTAVAMVITTGPGSDQTLRFGIWQHDPATGKPGTLVNDFGTVAVVTSATGTFSATGSVALTPGDYWVATRQSAFMTARRWGSSLRMLTSDANNDGEGGYGAAGTGAFGNAPTMTDVGSGGPIISYTLMRWNQT
jgi:hypothetical protein